MPSGGAVGALSVGAFEGFDVEPHLFGQAARDEAAHAVVLMPMSA